MNIPLIISIGIFFWPVLLLCVKLFRYLTYARVYLPCGTFRVRRMFRYDMNVMTRIVAKEFFDGGIVDAENMKVLYKRYGPLSWAEGRTWFGALWNGLNAWGVRYLRFDGYKLKKWQQEG